MRIDPGKMRLGMVFLVALAAVVFSTPAFVSAPHPASSTSSDTLNASSVGVYYVPSHHTTLYFVKVNGSYYLFAEKNPSGWMSYLDPVEDNRYDPIKYGKLNLTTGNIYRCPLVTGAGSCEYRITVPNNILSQITALVS